MASAETLPVPLAPAYQFPATWKASISTWWAHTQQHGLDAQRSLFRRGLQGTGIEVEDYATTEPATSPASTKQPSASSQKVAKFRKIDIGGGRERVLNVVEVGTAEKQKGEHAFLVIHGYGGGLGFYFQNLAALCSFPNTRIYFLDMLGMGLSGRPKFPSIHVKGDASSHSPTSPAVQARVTQAEDFFLSSFEDFAKHEGLNKFTMIGHSLGGYLSTAYALRHPERVSRLILVSPVGVPKSPYHTDEEEEAKLGEERAQLDRDMEEAPTEMPRSSSPPPQPSKSVAPRVKPPNTWWAKLWEANVSPFSVVRMAGLAGPKLVSTYARRRFATFEPEVQKDLFDYLYNVYGQKGSGEYCLAHILSPGAYARWPLLNRLNQLDPKIPCTFIYGENDWMDKRGGEAAVRLLRNKADASELQSKRSKVLVNPHAGHWTFLDNPEGMNKIFLKEMQETIRDHPVQT